VGSYWMDEELELAATHSCGRVLKVVGTKRWLHMLKATLADMVKAHRIACRVRVPLVFLEPKTLVKAHVKETRFFDGPPYLSPSFGKKEPSA
jgi:hypothetical protein